MIEKGLKPTYKRQRFLLEFIRQLSSGVTATDLQKLVFLYLMQEGSIFYEFIPYKFGPYSFQLADDVDILCKNEYLQRNKTRIHAIGIHTHDVQFEIAVERGDKLIRKAYREYPYYAINSEILGRLFTKKEAESFLLEKQHYIQNEQMLFTIGYEGKSIEAFINKLILNDIRLLCDVRKNPLSRKFGFSKNKLQHICETIGIQYIHIPELGIESNKRNSLNSFSDYQHLFSDYAKTLPDLQSQLEYVYSLLCSKERIALMCYEKEPEMCHRHVIKDYIVNTYSVRSTDL